MEILWKFLVITQFMTTIWGYFVMEAEAETTTIKSATGMPRKITDCPPGAIGSECNGGYEEYFLEHSITEKEAKKSLKELLTINYQRPAYCKECTSEIKKYCLGPHLLQDHCCCDLRHGKEELPWIPHSCYIGKNNCRPTLGSCLKYADYKSCCCDQLLLEQWKSIFSSALKVQPTQKFNVIVLIYFIVRFLV